MIKTKCQINSKCLNVKKYTAEPISKRFSLAKVKADQNFNRRNTLGISRIEIFIQRGDWPKWDVLKQALL
jgi:hypothetical protein